MGRVFTITEGVENLGALKSGGQGSVYKGRRTGEIITAIKILPTPIVDPANDRHYADFKNEVAKLKKVNEQPHPNVVEVMSWGITETGGFPFIEMEFIDGPDLAELLRPPHEPVFALKEAIRLAEQLSAALAHCHANDVMHGDIKSNNIKFNSRTGNYVLIDFGLAMLSDEQRRTSLRHAGAIEFMAPEQNEGRTLFATDIYSFGVILFELLAGRVPFPLNDNSEAARNAVMMAHMDSPVPDLVQLRRSRLPAAWSEEKKQVELAVPVWLTDLLYKCLQKDPARRFANGQELHDYILLNEALGVKKAEIAATNSEVVTDDNDHLLRERDALQIRLMQYQREAEAKDRELFELNAQVRRYEDERITSPQGMPRRKAGASRFLPLLLLTLVVGALALYFLFFRVRGQSRPETAIADSLAVDTGSRRSESNNAARGKRSGLPGRVRQDTPVTAALPPAKKDSVRVAAQPKSRPAADKTVVPVSEETKSDSGNRDQAALTARYKVRSRAYFYNEPDESTRRNAFIVHWNNAVLRPRDDRNGFVYIVFTNVEGQTSRGWMRKSDLIEVR